MNYSFPARIEWNADDCVYHVRFPDFSGCITYGATIEQAKTMASDALSGVLESMMTHDEPIPEPSPATGRDIYQIEPEPNVAFALWLRRARAVRGLTLTEAAERLGIKYQVYQRLENPTTANPTLKTIRKIEKAFG